MRGCLSDDTLLELVEGRRDLVADASLAAHIDACDACRRLIADVTRSRPDAPPAEPMPALERGAAVGRYTILDDVGGGAMGVVYAAHDSQLGRRVALKFLRAIGSAEELQSRIAREAQAMAKLAHPNVIVVHDVGAFAGHVFVAMELVDGATLNRWLADEPRSWRQVLAVLRQAAEGLAAAHAAGLVHRDFKPDNVLVGRDGRVRVTDFGLAREIDLDEDAAAGDAHDPLSAPRLDATLTRTGALVGTPAYMALEQLERRRVDERSDQFSFCVTLFEALFGARPFSGRDLPALIAATRAGRVIETPARGVPRWLRRVVVRGLNPDPEARWPSLRALLQALDAGPIVTAPRLAAALLLVAVAAGSAVVYRHRDPVCSGGAAAWGDLWSDGQRQAVRRAFDASGQPSAALAFTAIDRALGAYRSAFVQMHETACRATRISKSQSEAALDLRMACLEDCRRHAAALTRLYGEADADVVKRAVATLDELPPLEGCADVRALGEAVPLPRDPQRRAAIARVSAAAAEASALAYARKSQRSLTIVTPALAEMAALAYPPLEAKLYLVRARVEQNLGQHDAAVASLHRAAQTAERAHDDATAADAFNLLVWNRGYVLAFRAEAELWAEYAAAAIARLGRDGEREGTRRFNLGSVLWMEGRLDEAQPLLAGARALMIESRGADYWRVASVDDALGGVAFDAGRLDEALRFHRRAYDERVRTLGPDHPLVAASLGFEARDLTLLDRLDEALATFARVFTLMHAEGPDVEDGWVRHRLASALRRKHDFSGALAADRQALQNLSSHRHADDPLLCAPLVGEALDRLALGQARAALPPAERALPLCVRDQDPYEVAQAQLVLGRALEKAGQRARGQSLRQSARTALAQLAARYGSYYAESLREADRD